MFRTLYSNNVMFRTITAAEVTMNDKQFVVIHTGSSTGEVLKIGVMTGEYDDVSRGFPCNPSLTNFPHTML